MRACAWEVRLIPAVEKPGGVLIDVFLVIVCNVRAVLPRQWRTGWMGFPHHTKMNWPPRHAAFVPRDLTWYSWMVSSLPRRSTLVETFRIYGG